MLYIIFQILGALIAALILHIAFPESKSLGATIPSVPFIFAFSVVTILTFVLMFVILNVSTGHMEKGIMAGVAIGGTIFIEALIGGPLTGASMNPARSVAPALLSQNLNNISIYIIAPILGAILASPFCKIIQGKECCNNQ